MPKKIQGHYVEGIDCVGLNCIGSGISFGIYKRGWCAYSGSHHKPHRIENYWWIVLQWEALDRIGFLLLSHTEKEVFDIFYGWWEFEFWVC